MSAVGQERTSVHFGLQGAFESGHFWTPFDHAQALPWREI
jgi:hypothetical protein